MPLLVRVYYNSSTVLKMNYSSEELGDMMYILGECDRNPFLASRVYRQRYPARRIPETKSFERLRRRFDAHHRIDYLGPVRTKPVIGNEANNMQVLLSAIENPHVSARELSAEIDISDRSVRRIFKLHKQHPYHIIKQHGLEGEDHNLRMEFCNWAIDRENNAPNFFQNVMFSDESSFTNTSMPNRRNLHFYSDTNPYFTRRIPNQRRWSINVWAACLGPYIIGPHFFEGSLTGVRYLDFLQNTLPELLENVPLNIRQNMWFQHDGAPAHSTLAVRNFLNNTYPGRWIGRGGPVSWPARSPDLTPLDFFVWGYVKGKVYRQPPTTVVDMRNRIVAAFETITEGMMTDVYRSFLNRSQVCIQQGGGQFEHAL